MCVGETWTSWECSNSETYGKSEIGPNASVDLFRESASLAFCCVIDVGKKSSYTEVHEGNAQRYTKGYFFVVLCVFFV